MRCRRGRRQASAPRWTARRSRAAWTSHSRLLARTWDPAAVRGGACEIHAHHTLKYMRIFMRYSLQNSCLLALGSQRPPPRANPTTLPCLGSQARTPHARTSTFWRMTCSWRRSPVAGSVALGPQSGFHEDWIVKSPRLFVKLSLVRRNEGGVGGPSWWR